MIIKNVISNTSKYKLINFSLFINSINVGTSGVMVDIINRNDGVSATINNFNINKKYHKMGHGSTFLQGIETSIKFDYNVNRINLVAWQQMGNDNVIKIYKKNGYVESDPSTNVFNDYNNIYDSDENMYNNHNNVYDDYEKIYNLIQFDKTI